LYAKVKEEVIKKENKSKNKKKAKKKRVKAKVCSYSKKKRDACAFYFHKKEAKFKSNCITECV